MSDRVTFRPANDIRQMLAALKLPEKVIRAAIEGTRAKGSDNDDSNSFERIVAPHALLAIVMLMAVAVEELKLDDSLILDQLEDVLNALVDDPAAVSAAMNYKY